MAQIIFGDMFDPGEREMYEDRVKTAQIKTASGMDLVVAAVADGVGGQNKGELAAQEAINTLFYCIEASNLDKVHEILTEAVQSANQAVWQLHSSGACCTLAVAAVYKDTLYIANVGDSRIYLCRNNKLTQLTIDHNFATIMNWRGQMSLEEASDHPSSGLLMFAVGLKEKVTVDIGFYVDTTDFYEANERGPDGLHLKPGDSVMVCSDGLVKQSKKRQRPPVENGQIVQILSQYEGDKAAKVLVGIASGNRAEDNVSVAVLQTSDRQRRVRARLRAYALPAAVYVVMFAALLVMLIWVNTLRGDRDFLASAVTQTAQSIADAGTMVAGYTATFIPTFTPSNTVAFTPTFAPTATPLPTLNPGEIGTFTLGDQAVQPLFLDKDLSDAAQNLTMYVNQGIQDQAAVVWQKTGSHIRFTSVSNRRIMILVFTGSDLFIATGPYADGARISLARPVNPLDLSVSGSCMAIQYQNNNAVTAVCYEGSCTYSIDYASPVQMEAGKQTVINLADSSTQVEDIDTVQVQAYSSDLIKNNMAQACLQRYAPTATPAVTGTPLLPTATVTPGGKPLEGTPTATGTPIPPSPTAIQTAAPSPSSTRTALPSSTAKSP
jgi:PPM family protein phosphatase